jgi:hypothetical protein
VGCGGMCADDTHHTPGPRCLFSPPVLTPVKKHGSQKQKSCRAKSDIRSECKRARVVDRAYIRLDVQLKTVDHIRSAIARL